MKISPANSGSVKLTQILAGGREGDTEIATAETQTYTCFDINNTIRATAQPKAGYQFDRWTLVPTQSGFSTRLNPTQFINVDGTKTLTVYFTGGAATLPDPPTNVQASKGTYSDRVRVTWNASAGATSYEVHRATSAGGTKTRVATTTFTNYNDLNITCPTTYYYWIKAVSSAGASDFSASSTGYCQTGTTPPPPQDVTPVSAADAKKMLDEKVGLIVVDVSERSEYETGHILCARHAFYNDFFGFYLDYEIIGLTPYKASDILVYDQRGINGQPAAEYLASQGFASVYYLTGGLDAWIAAGHETVPCSYECDGCDLPPMAHAGPDRTVSENQNFTLDGSGSVNPGAGSLTYLWSQYKGAAATITNPNAAQPTIRAPYVQQGGETLIFHLTVTDAQGRKDKDSVAVRVTWANNPPVADAGEDQEVDGGAEVVLDGRDSTDPNGASDIATYRWVQTGGPTVALTGASSSVARFTAPMAENEALELAFELTVTDKGGQFNTDEVIITVRIGNQPPEADAGDDQSVGETAQVTLDGTRSTDPDGDQLFYEWRQIGTPAVALMQASSARPTFTAPMVAVPSVALTFELTVRDNRGGEDTDRVVITVTDVGEPPFADAGRSILVYEGDNVTLDGSGSFDLDGVIVSYKWVQISGTSVSLSGSSSARATFNAPVVEEGQTTLIFQVTVTDDTGLTDTDTMKVGVSSGTAPPTANAGEDQFVYEGDTVSLSGSAVSDLTYKITEKYWEQIGSGPKVTLSDATAWAPQFKAPKGSDDLTTLKFALTVKYEGGHVAEDQADVVVIKKKGSGGGSCFISTLSNDF